MSYVRQGSYLPGTTSRSSQATGAVGNINMFSVGINDTSGNTITVDYGWVRIS
jgi:hypothetical protein